jgi:uncharacterized phage protein (TIGR02220 family)
MDPSEALEAKALKLFAIVNGPGDSGSERAFNSINPSIHEGWLKLAAMVTLKDQPSWFTPDEAVAAERGWHKDAKDVLAYFNQAAGRSFREVDANMRLISARLREHGVSVAGIHTMIDRKVREWSGTQMEDYLRPETIFNATKFQSYYESRFLPLPQKPGVTVHPMTQLRTVREALGSHPANASAVCYNPQCSQEQRQEFRMLRDKEKELVRVVANLPTTQQQQPENGRRMEPATATRTEPIPGRLSALAAETAKAIHARSGNGDRPSSTTLPGG